MIAKFPSPSRGVIFLLVAFFTSSLLLAACGDTATSTPAPTQVSSTPASPNSGKVAVLLPGASSDGSWNSLGFEAVVRMRRELGLTVDFSEDVTPEKGLTVMRDYASKGYGLVILHGGWQYADAMKKAGQEFPNTWFLMSSDALAGPNLAGVIVKYEEITYLAGIAAARASKVAKFGFINGPKAGGNISMVEGFKQGVRTVKPEAEVFETYLDSWTDSPGATTAATSMFGKGAEVVIYSLNLPDQPVLKIAQENGKKAINISYDLNNLAPDTLLTSVLISIPSSLVLLATLWKDKKLEGKTYSLGLKEQALSLASFRGKLSKEDEAAIEKAKNDIVAGTIQIKTAP